MNRHERRPLRASLAVLAVANLFALPSCAMSGVQQPLSGGEASGVAHLQLALPIDLKVGEVAYEVTGNGIPPIDGVMVASTTGNGLGAVVSVPSGRGYTLRVSTVVGDNYVLCQTSTQFDVAKGDISEIPVLLKCDDPGSEDGGLRGSPSSDAAAKEAVVDAAQSKDAASSLHDGSLVDTASSHAPASGNGVHDAAIAIADAGVVTVHPSVAPTSDAAAPVQPSADSCDSCRLQVCSALGNSQRIVACFVSSASDWPSVAPPSADLPCTNPSECVRFVCANACAPHP